MIARLSSRSTRLRPYAVRSAALAFCVPSFPQYRPRRLRRTAALRSLVRETWLQPSQLVLPLFVRSGTGVREPVESMPGVDQTSVDEMLATRARPRRSASAACCCSAFLIDKDATGSEAWNDDAPVQQAVRALKRELPDLVVITDVCLCEYTDHGHCGVIRERRRRQRRDARAARARGGVARASRRGHRRAERHDGRPRAARSVARSTQHGFRDTPILSYAAKFAGPFYGPFREAAESTPQFGDRRALPDGLGECATRRCARSRSTSRKARTW